MIGLTGAVRFGGDSRSVTALGALMRGSIRGTWIRGVPHAGEGWAVEVLDDTGAGSEASRDGLRVFVAGEVYEDEVLEGRASAADVVLRAYAQDPSSAARLNGSYAFVVIDADRRAAALGTDENSFIPVYYTPVQGVLCFSWDISRLLRVGGARPCLDAEGLFAWLLVGGRGFADRTRFEGIRRLEPATVVTFADGATSVVRNSPFGFSADGTAEAQLLEEAAHALADGVRRRIRGRRRLAIGLSGGLDSRLVLAAAVPRFEGDWYCYTYGRCGFAEHDIAREVARHYGVPHATIVFPDDHVYIDYAADGVFYSGGASLFKHGVQPHLFAAIRDRSGADGLLLGSALDLVLGSTFSAPAVHDAPRRADLMDWYRRSLCNLPSDRWTALFREAPVGARFYAVGLEILEEALNAIPGEHPADVNDALAFDIRIKRWYNHNLVYPLISHRLLTPTYDRAFLDVVARVPPAWRRDSSFRIKLLALVDRGVAEIAYDETMQPAWLLPPHTKVFEDLVKATDHARQRVWFESGCTVYLPSNRYDANFLEWLRVYSRYRDYALDLLTGKNAVLADLYLDRRALADLVARHVDGTEANHKIITMLMSAELGARLLVAGQDTGVHYELHDFGAYLP